MIVFFCFSFLLFGPAECLNFSTHGLSPQNTRGLLLRVAGGRRHTALAWAPPGTDRDRVFPGLLCA